MALTDLGKDFLGWWRSRLQKPEWLIREEQKKARRAKKRKAQSGRRVAA